MLLTHAHLDHCGRLPLLCRQGFRGEIIPAPAPAIRDPARPVLPGSAHLHE
ncbi:metallo-beta-lactamase family protein [Citreicella sp. SE45]|nr:metallo-beta-lactamase family protein [Citreicella sp. SE45]